MVGNLKIGVRLGLAFGSMLLLMTLLTVTGILLIRSFGEATDHMIKETLLEERLVTEWRNLTEMNGLRTMIVARGEAVAGAAALEQDIKATSARISEVRKQLDGLVVAGEAKRLYELTSARRSDYASTREAVFNARAGADSAAVAAMVADKLAPALKAYLDSMTALATHFEHEEEETAAAVRSQGKNGQLLLGGVWIAALLCGVAATVLITRSITRPLAQALGIAQTIASGDLSSKIEVRSADETGRLLVALRDMNGSLMNIIGEVREGADVIATASGQISGGNSELSTRTEQQAGSLEETAASMEQLTASVRNNAEHARQAFAMAQSSSGVAEQGGAVVQKVVQTMGAISDSSRRIVDIIGVIDGIAFQTNILALNAAVEAARAGEQGRGFAVVASEVRNLAQRSAGAAKEIKTLIEDSAQQVDSGARLVDQAGASMRDIVGSIERVTAIMNDIMSSSSEQSDGIEQVNRAIIEMDGVTQQNAALVEEAAAAAQSMQDQAQRLAQSVSVFKVAPRAAASNDGRLRLTR